MLQSPPPWTIAPFTRLFIPFVVGIVLADICPYAGRFVLYPVYIVLVCLAFIRLVPSQLAYRLRGLQGICVQALILCMGIVLHVYHDPRSRTDWYGHRLSANLFQVRIDKPPELKTNSWKALVSVEAVCEGDTWNVASGSLVVFLARDGLPPGYKQGQRLLVNGKLKAITNPGNPGEFDYRGYAARHGLYHTIYVSRDQVIVTGSETLSLLDQFLTNLRIRTLGILRKYLAGDTRITGLAEALLIGYTLDLDREISQEYSRAGVIHVIAISGLHLGLIYTMLAWLCSRIPLVRKRVWLSVAITLICLWIFALLTGASASVLRSAVMFTVLGVGKMIGQKASMYNSLAASALLLCVYDSNYLWDMGFQLSYLALIGIAWLQKPIYRLLYIRPKAGRYLWEMASVTLAAQIFTTPLCLYYFHQFPVYFLVTNLLVVPLSTIVLCTEIFLLLSAWWPPAALLTGKLIVWQIGLMNAIVDHSNHLPGALVENIPMNLAQEWAVYLFIWAIACWWIGRSTIWKYITYLAAGMYASLWMYNAYQIRRQQKLVVYNLAGSSVIEWINGREGYVLYSSIKVEQRTRIEGILKQSHFALGISPGMKELPGQLFVINQHKILIINFPVKCDTACKPEIVLITGNPVVDMHTLFNCVQPAQILFDATNRLWKIEKWKKDCEELLLQGYSIPESGAFISDLH